MKVEGVGPLWTGLVSTEMTISEMTISEIAIVKRCGEARRWQTPSCCS